MPHLRLGAALFGALLFWLPAACDGDSETSSSGNGPGASSSVGPTNSSSTASTGVGGASDDPVGQWCDAVIGPFCEAVFACCSDPRVLGEYGGSVESCTTQWETLCNDDLGLDIGTLLAGGSTVLDTGLLSACVAKLDALSAGGASCTEPPRIVLFTDCITAFQGQIPAGGACVTTPDDISFVECSHGLCQNGQCEPFDQEGEACLSFCDYTVGLWCSFDGMNASCAPRSNIGEPCTPMDPNQANFGCKSLVCGPNGQCALPTPEMACASI